MHILDVDAMLDALPNSLFLEWTAFYKLEQEEMEAEQKRAEAKAGGNTGRQRVTI